MRLSGMATHSVTAVISPETILSSKNTIAEWAWARPSVCGVLDKVTLQVFLAQIAGVAVGKMACKGFHFQCDVFTNKLC